MRRHTGSPSLMQKINKSMILNLMKQREHISRAEIAKELKLSPPTVSKIIDRLLIEGWIVEIGAGASNGGRKPQLLQFNNRKGYAVGAWIGDRSLLAGVADLSGNILLKRELRRELASEARGVPAVDGAAATGAGADQGRTAGMPLEQELILLIYRTLKDAGIPADKLSTIGVAVCGITQKEGGTVVRSRHLPGWENFPIQKVLEQEFSVPVVVDGDTFMAVLGEALQGAGQGGRNLVRVTLGAGIGCGILLDERVYRGTTGAAGEIGDMIVCEEINPAALAGRGGYLEEIAGLSALVSKAQVALSGDADSLLHELCRHDLAQISPEMIFKAATAGDQLALALVRQTTEAMARAIANIASLLNPEQVILGGEMGEARQLILQMIQKRVNELLYAPPAICLSTLDRNAELYGAISLALEQVTPSVAVSYESSVLGAN